MRIWLARLLWAFVWPLRLYVRYSPTARGKWRLTYAILRPALALFPEDMTTNADVPGGRVQLLYSEELGKRVMIEGRFEVAELQTAISYAEPGTCAVDVGANVGLFTVALARRIGAKGLVLAFEPHPSNASRLKQNCVANGITNVVVHEVALSDADGVADLLLGKDPAYGSTMGVWAAQDSGKRLAINTRRLDGVWSEAERPSVSVIKIDVEGAELSVLRGARQLLAATMPAIILEANSQESLDEISAWLAKLGYVKNSIPSFEPWNFLFLPTGR